MLNNLVKNEEFRKELEAINMWYFEQLERYNKGEIKESTMKSYKTRHRQRRQKLIEKMTQPTKGNTKVEVKARGLFAKW